MSSDFGLGGSCNLGLEQMVSTVNASSCKKCLILRTVLKQTVDESGCLRGMHLALHTWVPVDERTAPPAEDRDLSK